MSIRGSNDEQRQGYQEGEIVAYANDTFRVRRNNGDSLEVVNHTGYQLVPTQQVEQTYYCGHCRCEMPISHFPH